MKKVNTNAINVLSKLGFVASGIMSYMLASTLCTSFVEHLLAFMIVVVMQSSSYFFFVMFLRTCDRTRILYGSVALLLFAISILGTLSYQFSQDNKSRNESIQNSEEYKMQLENIENAKQTNVKKEETLNELIALKKGELVTLTEEYNTFKAKTNERIEMYEQKGIREKTSYKTKIANLNKEITNKEAEINNRKHEINNEIKDLSEKKLEIGTVEVSIDKSKIDVLETSGFLSLAGVFERLFNVPKDWFILILQTLIAIIFEVTAVALHIAKELQNPSPQIIYERVAPIKVKVPTIIKQTPTVAKIGFQPTENKIQEIDIKNGILDKYLDVMNHDENIKLTKKGNKALGYKKIRDLAELTEGEAKKCFEYLKATNQIKVEGNATYINLKGE